MIAKRCEIKKDDKVKVIAGKDKGKIGKVVRVIRKDNRILVEHVNVVKRHTRPTAKNRQGGIIAGEAPVHVSNVMLMCNKCIKPVRIKMQKLENGKKARVCPKCSEVIDK